MKNPVLFVDGRPIPSMALVKSKAYKSRLALEPRRSLWTDDDWMACIEAFKEEFRCTTPTLTETS